MFVGTMCVAYRGRLLLYGTVIYYLIGLYLLTAVPIVSKENNKMGIPKQRIVIAYMSYICRCIS